ncbi:hypothetical protein NQP46_11720 [Streptomyces albus]|nr:hypothetical protein NQP46_11720 [Streptomyces albus]
MRAALPFPRARVPGPGRLRLRRQLLARGPGLPGAGPVRARLPGSARLPVAAGVLVLRGARPAGRGDRRAPLRPPTPERSPHPGRTPSQGGGWDWEKRTETACRAYEDGTTDADHRRRLERLAKGGPGAIERFCRGVLELPEQQPQLTLPAVPVPGTGGDRPDGGNPDFGYAPPPPTGDGEDAEDGAAPEDGSGGGDDGEGTGGTTPSPRRPAPPAEGRPSPAPHARGATTGLRRRA